MPVDAGGFGQVVSDVDAHPVTLGDADARPRYLAVEGVRLHALVGEDIPLYDGDAQVEDLYPVLDFRFERPVAARPGGCLVRDLARVDGRHLAHRGRRGVPGHDHPRGHDRAAHLLGAVGEVDEHSRDEDAGYERQRGQKPDHRKLGARDVRLHLVVHAPVVHRSVILVVHAPVRALGSRVCYVRAGFSMLFWHLYRPPISCEPCPCEPCPEAAAPADGALAGAAWPPGSANEPLGGCAVIRPCLRFLLTIQTFTG